MTQEQGTATYAEIAESGRQLAALMEHPGFAVLKGGIRRFQEQQTSRLMGLKVRDESSAYVDVIGQMKGAAALDAQIIPELLRNAEDAAAQLRAAEEGSA